MISWFLKCMICSDRIFPLISASMPLLVLTVLPRYLNASTASICRLCAVSGPFSQDFLEMHLYLALYLLILSSCFAKIPFRSRDLKASLNKLYYSDIRSVFNIPEIIWRMFKQLMTDFYWFILDVILTSFIFYLCFYGLTQ